MKILITESQLKSLILEQQKIKKVTDFCGRTKEVDYQQWYYGITKEYPYGSNGGQQASYVKCYKFDERTQAFVFNDWGCEFRNWSTMTEAERKTAIEGKKRSAGCGSADRFGVPAALKPYLTLENAEITVDIIQTVLQLVPPPGIVIAKAIGLIKAIYYAIRSGIYFYSNEIINGIIKGAECVAEIIQLVSAKAPGGTAALSASAKKAVELVDSNVFLRVLLQLESQGDVLVKGFKLENKFYKALMLIVVDVLIPKGQDTILSKISSAEISKLDPFKTISATPWLASIPWLASGVEFVKTILNLITKYLGLIQKIYSALD